MSDENFMRVRDVGLHVRNGLGPYVLFEYKFIYKKKAYLEILQKTLERQHPFTSENHALDVLDLQAWLNAIERQWNAVFKRKLSVNARESDENPDIRKARSYLNELRNTRNLFSHEAPKDKFSDQDVFRIADTATRLLGATYGRHARVAHREAEKTEDIRELYGGRIFGKQGDSVHTSNPAAEVVPEPTIQGVSDQQLHDYSVGEERKHERIKVVLSHASFQRLDLRRRNLVYCDLKNADLAETILRGEDLSHCTMTDAKLGKADLAYAVLTHADLTRADLTEALLEGTDLTYAKLARANLTKANLRMSKLSYADLRHANLTDADMRAPGWIREGKWSSAGDYDYDFLEKEVGSYNVNLSYAILHRAQLQGSFLVSANLERADMTRVNCASSRIESPRLAGAQLDFANLSDCHLLGCDFTGVSLQGAKLVGVEFVSCQFSNADMSGADLSGIYASFPDDEGEMDENPWTNVDLSRANLSDATLRRIVLTNANLTKATLNNSDLSHADLSGTDLTGAKFHGSNLAYTDLANSTLIDTDFTGAELQCVNFEGAKFRYTTILPNGSFWNEDTDMTKFTGTLDDR